MKLLVVGATPSTLRQLESLVPAGVRVVKEGSADWILVATAWQRAEAIAVHRLAPYRVVEVPELASGLDERAARDRVRAGLVAIAGIGRVHRHPLRVGVAAARMYIRRMTGPQPELPQAPVFPLPADALPMSAGVAGVAARIPAGARLDEILVTLARERVKRFVARAVKLG